MKKARKFLGIIAIVVIIGLGFTACTGGKTYALGDKGPGGGMVFYDKGSVSYGWRYLEAAPVNQEIELTWSSINFASTNITGTEVEIGTGKTNTAAILAIDANAPAAKACADYRGGGKNDWFLPSKDELNEMYKARTHLGMSGSFWSSTQHNESVNAWYLDFATGDTNWYLTHYRKNLSYNVRAIRAF